MRRRSGRRRRRKRRGWASSRWRSRSRRFNTNMYIFWCVFRILVSQESTKGCLNHMFSFFSASDETIIGFLVLFCIFQSPLGVSIGHLAAQGASQIGEVQRRQKLKVIEETKPENWMCSTPLLRTPRPPLDSAFNFASHTTLWLSETR